MKDYYSVLGVSHNVSQEVLDAVYKNFVKKHTETGCDISAIEEAYKTLSNPTNRLEYDKKLQNNTYTEVNTIKTDFDNKDDVIEFKYEDDENQSNKSNKAVATFILISSLLVILIILISTVFDSSKTQNLISNSNEHNENEVNNYYSEDNANINKTETDPANPEKYYIKDGTDFSNGVAFVKSETNEIFAIDTNGKILFKIDNEDDLHCTYENSNNNRFECFKFKNGAFFYGGSLYDISGNIIASSQTSGFDDIIDVTSHNYLIVEKLEESYTGDVVSYGVINSKGEWEVPLCSNGKWSFVEDYNTTIEYSWNENECSFNYIYNIAKNTGDAHYFYDDGYFFHEYMYGYKLFNKTGKLIIDLSEYEIIDDQYSKFKVFDFSNNHFCFKADNGTGNDYIFVMDTKGNYVVEPFKDTNISDFNLNNFGFSYHDGNQYVFFDFEGNQIGVSQEINDLNCFYSGLALATKVTDKLYYECCYVNPKGEIEIEYIS